MRNLTLLFIILLTIWLRFTHLWSGNRFIGDQAWFYLAARDALISGHFPLLGITSSITWLHQGPIWTYMLVPALWLSNFNPISGIILASFLGVSTVVCFYCLFRSLIGTLLLGVSIPAVVYTRMAYHTTPIPLFELLILTMLLRQKSFLSGLFTGLLYGLHLLSFIFWPFILIFALKKHMNLWIVILGFGLGILPFLISGPIQTGGIFIWVLAKIITGFRGVNGGSEAYFIVLLVPIVVILSWLLAKIPKYFLQSLLVIFVVVNIYLLLENKFYQGISLQQKKELSQQILSASANDHPEFVVTGPGEQFATTKDPYIYMVWWLARSHPPIGQDTSFEVNEVQLTYVDRDRTGQK